MSLNISKTKLKNFSLFSLGSKKFGFGHYNRAENLISILKNKTRKFFHYSYGENYKDKNKFLNKLKLEIDMGSVIVLDITNKLFLTQNTIFKLKKILQKKKCKIFIIDSPSKKNLSTILNIDYVKTLIPFEVTDNVKKKLLKIKKKKFGIEYFIYSKKNLKRKKKIYDIMISFGGSDNYEGTFRVLKILKNLKIKKKILVIIGKYFKENYKKKILLFCKKNQFNYLLFSKNFSDLLNKSKLLITNSGLTKYEGFLHRLPVIIFSDNKESQKIDKLFIYKTNQFHFSYLRNIKKDTIKLRKIFDKKINVKKPLEQNILKYNINKIKIFFENV